MRKGSVLVLTLWSLSLLSVFVLTVGEGLRQKLTLWKRLEVADDLLSLAYSAVEKAKAVLKEDSGQDLDTLNEGWSLSTVKLNNFALANGQITIGSPDKPGLVDEERKINFNQADVKTIQRVLVSSANLSNSEAEELAYCIVDWRDSDSNYGHAEYGAEDKDYEDERVPYSCKDAPMEALEELLLVKGMNRDIFNRLKPWVTVYGSGSVNVNTAPEEILTAVGLSQSTVRKILEHRSGPDAEDGTSDDKAFQQAEAVTTDLAWDKPPITEAEKIEIDNLVSAGRLGVASSFFTVPVRVSLERSPATLSMEAVINRLGKTVYFRPEKIDFHRG